MLELLHYCNFGVSTILLIIIIINVLLLLLYHCHLYSIITIYIVFMIALLSI